MFQLNSREFFFRLRGNYVYLCITHDYSETPRSNPHPKNLTYSRENTSVTIPYLVKYKYVHGIRPRMQNTFTTDCSEAPHLIKLYTSLKSPDVENIKSVSRDSFRKLSF